MREIDRATVERPGISSLQLMENAARSVFSAILALGEVSDSLFLVICGPGNNGGDGAAVARLLAQAGAKVDLVLIGQVENTKGNARTNFLNAKQSGRNWSIRFFQCALLKEWPMLAAEKLANPYVLVVDALFGTGLTRPVEGVYREVVNYFLGLRQDPDQPKRPVILSIDIPSGLNADLVHPIGPAIRADLTVSMTAPKRANVLAPNADFNGKLVVADIGSPAELIQQSLPDLFLSDEADAREWLVKTRYVSGSFKNTHGHVLVVAGSRGFTGAATLCGNAAMRSGAGLVTIATPASVQSTVASQLMPEIMTAALAETDRGSVSDDALAHLLDLVGRASVIALGPGLSADDDRTRNLVRNLVEQRQLPTIIDADGLNCLAPWPADLRGSTEFPIVLTPHPGEMLRLLGTKNKSAIADPVATARDFAVAHNLIVVLKGTQAIIAAPDRRVFINGSGNPGVGTAGAGDTLTGVISGFLAQAYGSSGRDADAFGSVVAAVFVSGRAADLAAIKRGMRSMVASDIREHLGEAIRSLDPEGEKPHATIRL
jgi:ADP-dependent NAD(P)H-hydrate dehydratase / NAD(P)H-hydrate epimerase